MELRRRAIRTTFSGIPIISREFFIRQFDLKCSIRLQFPSYELTDGQARDESGHLEKNSGIFKVKGFYTFNGTNGKIYRVDYTADENGFKPVVSESFSNKDEGSSLANDRVDPTIIKTLLGGG